MPKLSDQKQNRQTQNQLRIIGGVWRGRKLQFPNVDGLRPTGDRIRETLFNWLAPEIKGARCLDLFAGSGALGFEALSRGAAISVMLEQDPQAAKSLLAGADILQTPHAKIHHTNAGNFLTQPNTEQPFDIVFIDPPFELNLWEETFTRLEQYQWLSENASIYVESPRNQMLKPPSNWHLHRDKQAGQVSYQLFYRDI